MTGIERLVLSHIRANIPDDLDSYQFSNRENRSTEDAIFIALRSALCHLKPPNTYMGMLFLDFSLDLTDKPSTLGLTTTLCPWTFFQISHKISEWVTAHFHAHSKHWNTPKLCSRPSLLTTLQLWVPHQEMMRHYREEVQHLVRWSSGIKLVLYTTKTKEIIVENREKNPPPHEQRSTTSNSCRAPQHKGSVVDS